MCHKICLFVQHVFASFITIQITVKLSWSRGKQFVIWIYVLLFFQRENNFLFVSLKRKKNKINKWTIKVKIYRKWYSKIFSYNNLLNSRGNSQKLILYLNYVLCLSLNIITIIILLLYFLFWQLYKLHFLGENMNNESYFLLAN